jgi:hypothetical protein
LGVGLGTGAIGSLEYYVGNNNHSSYYQGLGIGTIAGGCDRANYNDWLNKHTTMTSSGYSLLF